MTLSKLRGVAAFSSIALLLAGPLAAETFRLSHNVGDTTTWHRGAERFNELLQEKTGGEHDVRIFPNAQLAGGDQMKQAEMTGRGAIDMVLTSAINVTPLAPEMAAFSLPYLYSDYAAVDATTAGKAGDRMEEIMAGHGIKVLAWGENGFREVTNNVRPIKTPEDLAGLKMRVAGPMYIDVMNALGANPVQMQWSETFPALQQGVVDGQENPIGAVIIPQRVYEVQDYLTTWHYSYDPIFLGVSTDLWESWDAETQAAVQEAATEAMEYQKQISREDTATGVEFLREQGMQVYEPTPEELAAFKAATQPAFDKWAAEIGPEIVELFVTEAASAATN